MGWCASSQLRLSGDCRFRFFFGVPPRCAHCPLLDGERAIRDAMGESPPKGLVLELSVGPRLRALLGDDLVEELNHTMSIPDYLPEEWGELPPGADPEEGDGQERR